MHWKITRGEFDLKKLFLVICLLTLILTGCGSGDKEKAGTTEETKESSTENPFSYLIISEKYMESEISMRKL